LVVKITNRGLALSSSFSQILLSFYFSELTSRSISKIKTSVIEMSEKYKEWWIGLPEEFEKDIESEYTKK
jgi:hypothetical protein